MMIRLISKIRNQIIFKKKKFLKHLKIFLYEILPITLPKIVIENFNKITKNFRKFRFTSLQPKIYTNENRPC